MFRVLREIRTSSDGVKRLDKRMQTDFIKSRVRSRLESVAPVCVRRRCFHGAFRPRTFASCSRDSGYPIRVTDTTRAGISRNRLIFLIRDAHGGKERLLLQTTRTNQHNTLIDKRRRWKIHD